MDDTQRLDALAEHGLCVTGHAAYHQGEWFYRWVCHFSIDQFVQADSIRDAIDLAVQKVKEESENAA